MNRADGILAFVKRECETCALVHPLLARLRAAGAPIRAVVQDEPDHFADLAPLDDTALEESFRHDIETVPTLVRVEGGLETGRVVGWQRDEWRALLGADAVGEGGPAWQPGCGSKWR